jgi:hypothetical protein
MSTDSPTPEMNSLRLEALTRLSSQLTATGFEKVTVNFSGQNSNFVLEEAKFFRTGLEEALTVSDVTDVFNGSTPDTSVITEVVRLALEKNYPFWYDLFGAYGTVSYYPSQFGMYIRIQRMTITTNESNLTRSSVESLYPKVKAA